MACESGDSTGLCLTYPLLFLLEEVGVRVLAEEGLLDWCFGEAFGEVTCFTGEVKEERLVTEPEFSAATTERKL